MTDDSFLIKQRDYSDIAKLQDPGVLEEFLDEPLTFIAETITGALATGPKGSMVAGGRIVQALLKGRLFKQWAAEFKKLRDAGRIPDDFAEKKYGFQTWVELMTIIDEESPDADRLEALKAMFFAVNKVGVSDGERVAAYQLWQIGKTLRSGEFLLLKTCYEQRNRVLVTSSGGMGKYSDWIDAIAKAAGHALRELIILHEKKLTEFGMLTAHHPDGVQVLVDNGRLTNMGIRFCENIEKYQIEVAEKTSVATG